MILSKTPTEQYTVDGRGVLVKREDLSCARPGPPFSKMRGVMAHLTKLKAQGVSVVGYVETSISMAGWGVAYGCHLLDMECWLFDPQYKETPELLEAHRKQWVRWGAKLIPVPAGRASVNIHRANAFMKENAKGKWVLLTLGLPLQETVEATKEEALKVVREWGPLGSVVVCVGSGTICAGLLRAFSDGGVQELVGVMSRTGNVSRKSHKIREKAQVSDRGLFSSSLPLRIIDSGWEYTERSNLMAPFPCHPYYDGKAWEWVVRNIASLKPPILFWNIGSEAERNP